MKKTVLALAGAIVLLGAPTAIAAPSCGYDNACEDGGHGGHGDHGHGGGHGGYGHGGGGGAHATGAAIGSPGVLSGNVVQVPIHIPINACGNTVNVIGLLNPAFGNTCINM